MHDPNDAKTQILNHSLSQPAALEEPDLRCNELKRVDARAVDWAFSSITSTVGGFGLEDDLRAIHRSGE
jgi:hypothetical protein